MNNEFQVRKDTVFLSLAPKVGGTLDEFCTISKINHKKDRNLKEKSSKRGDFKESGQKGGNRKGFIYNFLFYLMGLFTKKQIKVQPRKVNLPRINVPKLRVPRDIKINIQEDLRRILFDRKKKK
jgi:hypothetical protein